MTELVLILLAAFGIKHFVCDFLLQYPYMLAEKGFYGARGGIDHALIHSAGTFVILILILPWGLHIHLAALILALFDGIVHYHIDWLKQQLNRGLTPTDRMFWVWFGADQTLHYLTYIAIISVILLA
jgi:hypothetical protein